jgi:hypothetical protein
MSIAIGVVPRCRRGVGGIGCRGRRRWRRLVSFERARGRVRVCVCVCLWVNERGRIRPVWIRHFNECGGRSSLLQGVGGWITQGVFFWEERYDDLRGLFGALGDGYGRRCGGFTIDMM